MRSFVAAAVALTLVPSAIASATPDRVSTRSVRSHRVLTRSDSTSGDDSTINDSTINDSTINDSTINDSTINDSTINDSTINDPTLSAEVADTPTGGSVVVEILTADMAITEGVVAGLGGAVTGSVPGAVVQAVVPADQVAALAADPASEYVQAPRSVNQRARREFGPVTSEGVALTNANSWHAAGVTGTGVKVGVIDYFDLGRWTAAENGPLPDPNHMFCQDTSNVTPNACPMPSSGTSTGGEEHGVAVVEVLKDMAPGVEVFIATAGTVSDLRAAIDFFASKGVTILTRSLGAPYDGPGDGTGPLDSVVDYAASLGITWFNSAGNDASGHYLRRTVPTSQGPGYIDFDSGPGVKTTIRIDGSRPLFDGVRWANDWYLPAAQRTDYSVEIYDASMNLIRVADANQAGGAPPLEAADLTWDSGTTAYLKIRRNNATPVGAQPDTIEVAVANGRLELSDVAGSAAKSGVDSRNPALLAVGAVHADNPNASAFYSSQGPTNDGRIKPDIAAPAAVTNTIYGTFAGTSAASPAAAGIAALLYSLGLVAGGASLGDFARKYATDRGPLCADNGFGLGFLELPSTPTPTSTSPAQYVALSTPTRILDTRPASSVGSPCDLGPHVAPSSIDVQVLGVAGLRLSGASAVAVNITATDAPAPGFVQGVPAGLSTFGTTSTINIAVASQVRPNFAIVPVGANGKITLFLSSGGNVLVDVLGYFAPTGSTPVSAGRFTPIDPERWADTREQALLPAGFASPRLANAGESIIPVRPATSALPATGVRAIVANITSVGAVAAGFLRAQPAGADGLTYSTVNYPRSEGSANSVIVPVGAGGAISVFTLQATNVIVDVVGYITDDSAPAGRDGLLVTLPPSRAYDSRDTGGIYAAGELRTIGLVGQPVGKPQVPASATAISANLTIADPAASGWLKVFAGSEPLTSNVNAVIGQPVGVGSLVKLSPSGTVTAKLLPPGNVIIDINGYFTGPS